jgi:hypothetical protein
MKERHKQQKNKVADLAFSFTSTIDMLHSIK